MSSFLEWEREEISSIPKKKEENSSLAAVSALDRNQGCSLHCNPGISFTVRFQIQGALRYGPSGGASFTNCKTSQSHFDLKKLIAVLQR